LFIKQKHDTQAINAQLYLIAQNHVVLKVVLNDTYESSLVQNSSCARE